MFQQMIDAFRRQNARTRMVRNGMIADPPRPEEDRGIGAESSRVLACFIIVLLWSTSSLLMTLAQKNPQSHDLPVIGQKAPVTINAAFDFQCENREETERAKRTARQEEPKYFSVSAEANAAVKSRIDRFFSAIQHYPGRTGTAEGALAAELPESSRDLFLECVRNPSARRYVDDVLNRLLASGIASRAELDRLPDAAKVRIGDLQKRYRLPRPATALADPATAAEQLATALIRFQSDKTGLENRRKTAAEVFLRLLGPDGTLRAEPELTRDAAQAAADRINPVVNEYRKYQAIVRKGDLIDAGRRELLERYFAERDARGSRLNDFFRLTHNMFWSIALILLGAFYLFYLHRDAIRGNGNLAILGSIILLSLAAEYAGIRLFYYLSGESQTLPSSLVIDAVPVGLTAVLLSPIMGFRVALCAGFYTASTAALMLNLPFEYALKGIVISLLSALAVRQATNYRSYFLWTIFTVTPLVWVLNSDIFARLNEHEPVLRLVVQTGELAIFNGIATSMLALLVIFSYELLFKISTNMSLMLLCDYNHPLLERMKREAPGTFFHSLTVATLAEDAARAIGANYLRAKAGAQFHDIGKLVRPQYFTENNQNSANQHTALTPQMSSIIIRDHVKEGLALARQYKLGSVVRDAIAQHHGTDLVHFFHHAALENSRRTGEPVDEAAFRYPGPRPQSREIAIISLADACEAASRSLDKPTPEKLEALVGKIIEQRFKDGQLQDADLTLAELEKVRESFVNTLMSMKHGRIAYREEDEEEHEDPLPVDAVRRAPAEKS